MSEEFYRFKKKIFISLLIKCIIIAFSTSLLVFSGILIYNKIKTIDYNLWLLIIIAMIIFIVITGLLFIIFKPSDYKVAKYIDNNLGLDEKVQTMVEYIKEDSFMIRLQRESTNKILNETPIKKLTIKYGLMLFIFLGVACAISVTAISIPNSEDEIIIDPPITDPDYEADNWTLQALQDLIKYVKEKDFNESLKNHYVKELENLVVKIQDAEKESQMKDLVYSMIDDFELQLDIINTNNEVFSILRTSEDSKIVDLGTKINLLEIDNVDKLIGGLVGLINGSKEAIIELDYEFGQILKKSNLNQDDELYIELVKLCDMINSCREVGDAEVNNAVLVAINNQKPNIIAVLDKQFVNKETTEYVISVLKIIFELRDENDSDISDDENQENNTKLPGEDDDDDNKDEENASGGYGSGEILFGSDDAFFDPEEGVVIYGDVVTKYYGAIIGKFDEGNLSEEAREIFSQYYSLLLGTNEENK